MHKNKKVLRETQDFLKMFKGVLHVFTDVQETVSLNKSHVMELITLHKENAFFFDKAFEQAYIKIFKCLQEKPNKKAPPKFETLADNFFKQILKSESDETVTSFNCFCDLMSEAVYSSIMNVRIMASRILFSVLKSLPTFKSMNVLLTEQTQNTVSKAVLFLLKTRVSTYRQLGIKLSSVVLHCKSDSHASIENELFNILSTEQNEMIRKMVMTNIPIYPGNIDRILIRLRDKNPQIRATLLRRLLGENYKLQNLKLNNIYKILYDGYGTKDVICKEEALRYFAVFFKEGEMDSENKFEHFVQLFQPNLLLVNSHLYVLFNKLLGELLAYLPQASVCEYVRKLCNKVKSILKDKNVEISDELIWLKSASSIRPEIKEVNNAFEEYSPSGTQLAELFKFFLERKNIFAINEFLQMFTNIKMPDQIGRNRMYDTLRQTLKKITFFELNLNLNEIKKNDDICNVQTKQQIHLKKFMLSYYDIQIISNSMDLIFPIVSAMKYLRPESFVIEIQQTISDLQNPDEFPFLKQKSIIQLTLNSLLNNAEQRSSQKNKDKISYLKEKLLKIDELVQFLKYKTVITVTSVSKIQHDWNLEPYLPLIKEEISRNDQSNGIYLLGLHCLGDVQRVSMFFPLFWHNIMEDEPKVGPQTEDYQQYKLKLMISLKIMTDFIVKFNILNAQGVMNSTGTDESTDYNSDLFMQKITHLILSKDTDIRIFSIECLCRMIYHNRVDEINVSTYFLYLLLLWWETSTQEVSAKSVHTISLFFRSYIEKGNEQVKKLAQMLCIFHKILRIFEEKKKTINKKLITYNLKINEFIKKTASIATTVLKYHKEKKTIWTYEEPQLGPQEFFLLYLLYEPGFQNILEKPVNICDFYVKCPLETLIFVKKKVERFAELVEQDEFYPKSYIYDRTVTKKALEEFNRFDREITSHIEVKNEETFNEEIINTLEKIFSESCKFVNEEARRIAKNIEDEEIFISIDSDAENESIDEEGPSLSDRQGQNSEGQEDADDMRSINSSSRSISNSSPNAKIQEPKMISSATREKQKINNAQKKQAVIMESDSQHENSLNEDNNSEEEADMKAKTSQKKNRKRVPVERNLSARQQMGRSDQKIEQTPIRTTRSRKPIL